MAERVMARTDFVPHLPDLMVSMATCWRAIRDSQTEVDPFGPSYGALEEARAGLEILAHHLTGQSGFFALADAVAPHAEASELAHGGAPF